MFKRTIRLFCLMAGMVTTGLMSATLLASEFSQLDGQVQTVLKPFESRWHELPAQKQQKLIQGAQRWMQLNPQQRETAQKRFGEFSQLPQAQRQRALQQMQTFKSMTPDQRKQLRQRYQQFKQLPVERQQQLREQFNQQKAEKRQGQRPPESGQSSAKPNTAPVMRNLNSAQPQQRLRQQPRPHQQRPPRR